MKKYRPLGSIDTLDYRLQKIVFPKYLENWNGNLDEFWESNSGKECYEKYSEKFVSGFVYGRTINGDLNWYNVDAGIFETSYSDGSSNMYDKVLERARNIDDYYLIVQTVRSILSQSLLKDEGQNYTGEVDIEKFERGLSILRNKSEVREVIDSMTESFQTDMKYLTVVLNKLKAKPPIEDKIGLNEEEIKGLLAELSLF